MMKPHVNNSVLSEKVQKKKGIALVTVISLVAVITVLVVSMITLSGNERTASTRFFDTERSRALADSAVSLAMSQIWDATSQDATETGREIWASQPGAIRQYKSNGGFLRGYKLYSSDQMVLTGAETAMTTDTPAADWQAHPDLWADLNAPVIRPASLDSSLDPELIFPIVDPRAYVAAQAAVTENTNIEGFSYKTDVIPGVVDAENPTDKLARLPMPVKWLYLLKDGTLGVVTSSGSGLYTFAGASGETATEENPIVGRIAFWTDDETSKININTASEPAYWTTPNVYHERDEHWAVYQPTRFEFQRYPGHPATVALSTVLFPNQDLDPYGKTGTLEANVLAKRERIFQIMPKINSGGSISGTVPFWAITDNLAPAAIRKSKVDISKSLKERLYASVDDLIFSEQVVNGERLLQDSTPGVTDDTRLFGTNPERSLERVRAFLTAHSRSPEVNMFGKPRVAIWPVANESKGADYRTVYDNMIAWCASMGNTTNTSKSYFFRRGNSLSPTEDVSLERNQKLLAYLHNLMGRDYPNGGASTAKSFVDKYGDDAAFIVTQIFDYIRSTNVYDGVLAPSADTLKNTAAYKLDNKPTDEQKLSQIPAYKTFTADRGSKARGAERIIDTAFPGHGMVAPSRTTVGGVETRGQGRFVSLSEVGLHFICTADGTNDEGSYRIREGTNKTGEASGGRTAPKILLDDVALPYDQAKAVEETALDSYTGNNEVQYWYSNFPPFPTLGKYGTSSTGNLPETDPLSWRKHPGYDPENWNATLNENTELTPGQRRVQGMLMLELTSLSPGWGGMMPNLCVKIESDVRIGSNPLSTVPLFNSAKEYVWRSGATMWAGNNVHMVGGSVSPNVGLSGRRLPISGNVPADSEYESTIPVNPNKAAINFDFITDFHTIDGPVTPTTSSPHQMYVTGGPLKIKIYTGQEPLDANLVQTVLIDLTIDKDGNTHTYKSVPTPELVRLSTPRNTNSGGIITRRIEAPHWWAFHHGGALNRWQGIFNLDPETGTWIWTSRATTPLYYPNAAADLTSLDPNVEKIRTLGRLFHSLDNAKADFGIPRYQQVMWMSPGVTSTAALKPYYKCMRPFAAHTTTATETPALPPNMTGPFGQDSMVNLVPKHSDFRLLGAKQEVPATDWRPHPRLLEMTDPAWAGKTTNGNDGSPWFVAHSYMRYGVPWDVGTTTEINPDDGTPITDRRGRLVKFAPYGGYMPDVPLGGALAHRYRDFDNPFGAGNMRDGPWINWPDEGNVGVDNRDVSGVIRRMPCGYFGEPWRSATVGDNYMTPNRMMPSPGMFGSLPTGIVADEAWRTLLFRPNLIRPGIVSQIDAVAHPGAPSYFGGTDPADHYLLDLFWMPVVEPYAISEPLSTAGKINLNYQMVPFNKYIRRATGLHAVLKGEMMHALPTEAAQAYRGGPSSSALVKFELGEYYHNQVWTDIPANIGNYSSTPKLRHWHRNILADQKIGGIWEGTLGQFERRFEFAAPGTGGDTLDTPTASRGLFRTASQICEIHLIPKKISGTAPTVVTSGATPAATEGGDGSDINTPYGLTTGANSINAFWEARAITGDNARERPYTNIYQKITTQSNTYRVHYRAQPIRKARSSDPNQFDPTKDTVTADYRGSALIERRIDPTNPSIPDFALPANFGEDVSLDDFYSFRVLENKRFAP